MLRFCQSCTTVYTLKDFSDIFPQKALPNDELCKIWTYSILHKFDTALKKSEHKTSKLALQSRKATASFKNGAVSPKYPHGKKNKSDPYFIWYTQNPIPDRLLICEN